MFPDSLVRGLTHSRLKRLLLLIFAGLAIPTAVLVWQAYGQLKWEAFHQYRASAEELGRRIDSQLSAMMQAADNRSFSDYTFLVVSGDPSANFLQRSPLASFPVSGDLPGVIGYFQIDASGSFSTPILPTIGTDPARVGISESELSDRTRLADSIQDILADNSLATRSVRTAGTRGLPETVGTEVSEPSTEPGPASAGTGFAVSAPGLASMDNLAGTKEQEQAANTPVSAKPPESLADSQPAAIEESPDYSQQRFDDLKLGTQNDALAAAEVASRQAQDESAARQNVLGKVADMKLDERYELKSEKRETALQQAEDSSLASPVAARKKKRTEINALPEPEMNDSDSPSAGRMGADSLRISTFESEVDPFEFSLLDSGHFVLFRNVWRNGQRIVQGQLLERDAFIRAAIDTNFSSSLVADAAKLLVAYDDDIIHAQVAAGYRSSRYTEQSFTGSLLYRTPLSAPLDRLHLIFSIENLPVGPGAAVLGWMTLVLALVFSVGFLALYRLGVSQINLATQQQDFVSAVSHELKTPLTSIRMYGEMLKEGWADDSKRQGYYEFIHDESERLTRLISNILQLARITRNDPQIDAKPVKVAELMSQVESKTGTQIARAGFAIKYHRDAAADDKVVYLDADCFAQVIINLVDNALKFSRNAAVKEIEVSSKLNGDGSVVFAVRDFGPGVAKDQMEKIFALFYRSENELTRETVGTGIGLAIVQQLTRAMDGRVDLVNRDPGAELRVSFPVTPG